MLDFEKPLFEIRNKIDSLKESQEKNEVDLQDEIDMLEASLKRETTKVYTNLKPWIVFKSLVYQKDQPH